MNPGIQVDTGIWPAVFIRVTGDPGAESVDAYFRSLAEFLARGERYAIVFDALQAGTITADQRRRQARWMHENQALIRERNLGTAFVFSSPVFRAVYQAVLWLQPLPCPHTVCQNLGDAVLWVGERLQGANIPLPVGLMQQGVPVR